MDKEQAKKQRQDDPAGRDRYLDRCREQSDQIYSGLRSSMNDLEDWEIESIAETAEYLEDQSIGIEGVDY